MTIKTAVESYIRLSPGFDLLPSHPNRPNWRLSRLGRQSTVQNQVCHHGEFATPMPRTSVRAGEATISASIASYQCAKRPVPHRAIEIVVGAPRESVLSAPMLSL